MINANALATIDNEIFDALSDAPPARATAPTSGQVDRLQWPARPFDRVIGQSVVVELLRRIATGITYGGESDPILLQGPSGRGKTLLASQFAEALSLPLVAIMCGREIGPAAFVEKIAAHTDPVVLFLDEVHGLPKRTMETLYMAIDEARLPALKNGSIDRTSPPMAIARHVWVAASNMPGGILRALRSRLLTIGLSEYTHDELEQIALLKAESLNIALTPAAISLVALACGGSPRALGHVLKTISVTTVGWQYERDAENADATLDLAMVEEVVALMGLDGHGLDTTSRALLATIEAQPSGSASAETLSISSGLDLPFVRERLADLRARGFVAASPGRGWTIVPRSPVPVRPVSQAISSVSTQGVPS